MAKKACSTSYLKVYLTVSQDRFKGNILLVIFYHPLSGTSNQNQNIFQEFYFPRIIANLQICFLQYLPLSYKINPESII